MPISRDEDKLRARGAQPGKQSASNGRAAAAARTSGAPMNVSQIRSVIPNHRSLTNAVKETPASGRGRRNRLPHHSKHWRAIRWRRRFRLHRTERTQLQEVEDPRLSADGVGVATKHGTYRRRYSRSGRWRRALMDPNLRTAREKVDRAIGHASNSLPSSSRTGGFHRIY